MTEEVAPADLLADGQLQLGVSRGPPNRAGNEVREKQRSAPPSPAQV